MDPHIVSELTQALRDRYAIERELGRGGMATVFRARDLKHGRAVAVKVLNPELGAVLGAERFQSEIRVTATLQHPNLLPLFDSGEAAGQLFYVMPYVEGESLRARLDRERQLPVDEALRLVTAMASALDYAHGHGVIHRDLKPENILLQAGQPIIADFGIALAVSNAGGSRVTQTGLSLGTPQYMSPEQATGERQLDARSDQYSLAAVAYELLTGEPPHTGGTAQVIIARLMTETARPVRATRPAVSQAASDAIARALSKTPADRFATTREFADALMKATTPRAGVPRRWLAATGVALAIGAIAWGLRGRTGARTLSAQDVLVVPTSTGGNTALAARAASVDDALGANFGTLGFVRVHAGKTSPSSDADAAAMARAEGAASIAVASLLQDGANVQLRLRLIDAVTGAPIRTLPAVALSSGASSDEVRRAVEPLVVAAGFVASPTLGAVTLPLGTLPSLGDFREFEQVVTGTGSALSNLDVMNAQIATLRKLVDHDSTFTQAKLWLGFKYGSSAAIARAAGGAARADTVRTWSAAARQSGSPYEAEFAEFVVLSIGEVGDTEIESLRRLLARHPNSPLVGYLPAMLRELNRVHASITAEQEFVRAHFRSDSEQPDLQTVNLTWMSEAWHFLGQFDSSLVMARRARKIRPNDAIALSMELQTLAAMGKLDELRALMPQVESAAANGATFGFPGNTYLTVGQELVSHGHPTEGRVAMQQAYDWFVRNAADVRKQSTGNGMVRWALVALELGKLDEAEQVAKEVLKFAPDEMRMRGVLGRVAAKRGDKAAVQRELDWLNTLPADRLLGGPTYERAVLTVNLGRDHWDEALTLLEKSIKQGQGWGIRRRIHWFADWRPLLDYPGFKRINSSAD